MKHCNSCNKDKSKLEFGNRKASPDGLSHKCKVCQSEYDKARANNKDRVLAREKYAKTDSGRDARNRARKKWANENKDKAYDITKSYRKNNPKKYKAHGKVAYEVKKGNLTAKPCVVCSKTGDVQAHHDDYDRPLDVRWLCARHHSEWHRLNGEGLNAS